MAFDRAEIYASFADETEAFEDSWVEQCERRHRSNQAYHRAWAEANKVERREYRQAWYQANKARLNAKRLAQLDATRHAAISKKSYYKRKAEKNGNQRTG